MSLSGKPAALSLAATDCAMGVVAPVVKPGFAFDHLGVDRTREALVGFRREQ
jgi:hypothetical protein